MNINMKMKKSTLIITIIFLVSQLGCSEKEVVQKDTIQNNFEVAQNQYSEMIKFIGNSNKNPRSVDEENNLVLVPSKDWTSGFFPGGLWYLYEYTNNKMWKKTAEKFTERLEIEKLNARTHDMGFKMFCSFGNGYRLTKNESYKKILLKSAETLASRFNKNVGCIRSWDHHKDVWQFPVIIDNMMNLELLFWATKISGDSTYYNIAVSHANTTLKNHFRKDNSSWHVVNYDSSNGAVINKHTHQGYSHESSWSRGQAWGLYGYTMCYRETKDIKYLVQAEKIATYILTNKTLPKDGIPYWDFDAPNIPNEERDVSAATIIASALYELTGFETDNQKKKYYKNFADKILQSLTTKKYFAEKGNSGFILKHSVGGKPKNSEVDVPLIYADYYFLEANLRKLNFN